MQMIVLKLVTILWHMRKIYILKKRVIDAILGSQTQLFQLKLLGSFCCDWLLLIGDVDVVIILLKNRPSIFNSLRDKIVNFPQGVEVTHPLKLISCVTETSKDTEYEYYKLWTRFTSEKQDWNMMQFCKLHSNELFPLLIKNVVTMEAALHRM